MWNKQDIAFTTLASSVLIYKGKQPEEVASIVADHWAIHSEPFHLWEAEF